MTHPANPQTDHRASSQPGVSAPVLAAVSAAVERLRYGVVQLTVHDGRVVQLDVTERQRFVD